MYTGPKITFRKLKYTLDTRNNKNRASDDSLRSRVLRRNHGYNLPSIQSSIDDTVNKNISLDGTDDVLTLSKITETFLSFPKTVSIYCKPEEGSHIFNDSNGMIVHFTRNRKVCLYASPPSHIYDQFSSIIIDSNNDITLLGFRHNHVPTVYKYNLDGELLNMRRGWSREFSYSYCYGKTVEYEGQLYTPSFRGYSITSDIFNTSYTKKYSSTALNVYRGDIDIKGGYYYGSGEYYDNKVHKTKLTDYTDHTTFGTGVRGSGTNQIDRARGTAAGTNYVFIADTYNHRVLVLNKSNMTYNTHLGTTGTNGNTDSLFNFPRGGFIYDGKYYVGDYSNSRVKVYNELTLAFIKSISVSNINPGVISISSDGYMACLHGDGRRLRVIDLSDDSSILYKEWKYESNGPGKHHQYAAKAIRRHGNDVFMFDRNGTYFRHDIDDLFTYDDEIYHGEGDANDLAIDNDYFYTCYSNSYIKKIDRSTLDTAVSLTTQGSGNGEYNYPTGLAVDDNYLYVADTNNHRIQLFNKSDLSYHSQFGSYGTNNDGAHFYSPYSVEINDNKIYVADYNNYKVRIYNQSDCSYIASFSTNIPPYRIRVYGDEIFILQSDRITVYDKTTYAQKRYKDQVYGYEPGYTIGIYSFEVTENKIMLQGSFVSFMLDKETLEVESSFGPWYKCALIDTTLSESDIFIDVVLTDDYKVKVFANGYKSNEIQYTSEHDFITACDALFGQMNNKYSQNKYEYIAYYDTAKTLLEHTTDYNNIKNRRIN